MNKIKRIVELKGQYRDFKRQDPDEFFRHIVNLYGVDPRKVRGYEGWAIDRYLNLRVLSTEMDPAALGAPNVVDVWHSEISGRYISEYLPMCPELREAQQEAHKYLKLTDAV